MILCHLQQSSGCLGCFIRPPVNTSASNLSKELGVPGRSAGKRSISEDFWTTSTCDMDNSAVQSQGSISSLGTNNLIPDTNVPHTTSWVAGFLLWNQTRQRWIGNKKAENRTHQVREPKLNWNATYESLLGSNKPFPQPIPLSEMVDFLVDIWEQEGMYD
ncbi:hypothetical protein WN944_022332 [Citrus x changshan-huyou]|uniref:Gag1-like clamp domain-containing protein n=1 Tax=Citrus x changshan-huyou TaxID=2935761 RepID=A0AAP0N395_9ROSI